MDTVALLKDKLAQQKCSSCGDEANNKVHSIHPIEIRRDQQINHLRKRGYSEYDTNTSSPYDSSIDDGDIESTMNK